MNKFTITSTLATAVIVASMIAPAAFADTNVTVTGNGFGSYSSTGVNTNSNTSVSQTSSTYVSTEVSSASNTGNNTSSFNTGGSSNVGTGGSTTNVSVNNNGGNNVAVMTPMVMPSMNNVNLSGNGAFSTHMVGINNNTNSSTSQYTICTLANSVGTSHNTGGNTLFGNTNTSGGVSTGITMTSVGLNNNCGGNGASN